MKPAISKTRSFTTRDLTLIGLMTSVTCILAPIAIPIPISPVPISLGNLAVFLTIFVLGTRNGLISYLIYFLLGFAGLPVFSGFAGGAEKVLGPTGGYLIGFFLMAAVTGIFLERSHGKRGFMVIGMILGMLLCNLIGTLWLSFYLSTSFVSALGIGVLPYLPGDLLKIAAAAMLGPVLRNAVQQIS